MDVGHKVRVTGVTIQPVNGAEAHRVTSFKVQYSWLGILWEYVKESGEDKVRYYPNHVLLFYQRMSVTKSIYINGFESTKVKVQGY